MTQDQYRLAETKMFHNVWKQQDGIALQKLLLTGEK